MRERNASFGLILALLFIICQSIPAGAEEPLGEKIRQLLQEQKKPIQTQPQTQATLPESIDALEFDPKATYLVSIQETSQGNFAVLVGLEPIGFVYHNASPSGSSLSAGCGLYKEFRSANEALAWAQPFTARQVTGVRFLKKYRGSETSGIIYTYSAFNVSLSQK